MKIDHIALYTNDIETMRDFYITYFQAVSNSGYHNRSTGLHTYFLSFGDNTRLELMTRPGLEASLSSPLRTGYIHLAFGVGSKQNVGRLTALLERDGYTIFSQPRTTGDGYYESCILDPDGNLIEITAS